MAVFNPKVHFLFSFFFFVNFFFPYKIIKKKFELIIEMFKYSAKTLDI